MPKARGGRGGGVRGGGRGRGSQGRGNHRGQHGIGPDGDDLRGSSGGYCRGEGRVDSSLMQSRGGGRNVRGRGSSRMR